MHIHHYADNSHLEVSSQLFISTISNKLNPKLTLTYNKVKFYHSSENHPYKYKILTDLNKLNISFHHIHRLIRMNLDIFYLHLKRFKEKFGILLNYFFIYSNFWVICHLSQVMWSIYHLSIHHLSRVMWSIYHLSSHRLSRVMWSIYHLSSHHLSRVMWSIYHL